MTEQELASIGEFVQRTIPDFHTKRLDGLAGLKLRNIVKRKNPYLFRAKNMLVAADIVRAFLDAHLSSQEEGVFGGFLEQLAIEVCARVYQGRKSVAEGIDLEFEREGILYIVSIKSGPNWGNSGQIARMKSNFTQARRIYATNARPRALMPIEGCCYGRPTRKDFGDYQKLCGQDFWELISGDDSFYLRIVEPIGHDAHRHNEAFRVQYAQAVNRLVAEFSIDFCAPTGEIDWEKLLRFNSGRTA